MPHDVASLCLVSDSLVLSVASCDVAIDNVASLTCLVADFSPLVDCAVYDCTSQAQLSLLVFSGCSIDVPVPLSAVMTCSPSNGSMCCCACKLYPILDCHYQHVLLAAVLLHYMLL